MSRAIHASSSLLPLSKSKAIKLQVPLPSALRNLLGRNERFGSRISEMLQGSARVSTSRKSVSQFRTFCTNQDLASRKCVSCSTKELQPMTEETANNLIPQVKGWNLINEDGKLKLKRSWKVKSFVKGLELFKLVGDVAESEAHHPDLHLVGWNNVTIDIWTHSVVRRWL